MRRRPVGRAGNACGDRAARSGDVWAWIGAGTPRRLAVCRVMAWLTAPARREPMEEEGWTARAPGRAPHTDQGALTRRGRVRSG
jgi:hypothetical protein